MTKAEKRIVKTVVGSIAGAAAGAAFGVAKLPLEIACGLTSPVSYPVVGAVAGLVNKPMGQDNTVANAAFGMAIGACLVPFTPVILACTPINPFAWSIIGGTIGGIIGNKKGK